MQHDDDKVGNRRRYARVPVCVYVCMCSIAHFIELHAVQALQTCHDPLE